MSRKLSAHNLRRVLRCSWRPRLVLPRLVLPLHVSEAQLLVHGPLTTLFKLLALQWTWLTCTRCTDWRSRPGMPT